MKTTTIKMNENKNRFILLLDWNQYYPWPKINGLRYLIFNADITDFNKVIVRAGNNILIDEQAYFDWFWGKIEAGLEKKERGKNNENI